MAGLRRHMKEVNRTAPNFFQQARRAIYRVSWNKGYTCMSVTRRRYRTEQLWSIPKSSPMSTQSSIWMGRCYASEEVASTRNWNFHSLPSERKEIVNLSTLRMDQRIVLGATRIEVGNKIIKYFSDSSLGDKCSFSPSNIRKLLPKVKEKESANFCWKPKNKTPLVEDACWFTLQACSRNFLGSVVKSVCEWAGIHGKPTSLRATGATRLFAANVPKERDIVVLKYFSWTATTSVLNNSYLRTQRVHCDQRFCRGPESGDRKVCKMWRFKEGHTFDNCQNCTMLTSLLGVVYH